MERASLGKSLLIFFGIKVKFSQRLGSTFLTLIHNSESHIILSDKKYNCSGALTFKSQRVGYQSNQKLLHHYQHAKNQLNS